MALTDVTGAVTALVDAADQAADLDEVIRHLCHQAVRAVPHADVVSVTLLTGTSPRTVAITERALLALDLEQYAADDGPCLHAARRGEAVHIAVADAGPVWPAFAGAARDAGVGSVLSAPLVVAPDRVGSVNCFSRAPEVFDDLDEHLLVLYVAAAQGVLRGVLRRLHSDRTVEQLTGALAGRGVIEQAKGILMATRGITADAAYATLVQRSQHENVKLRLVAQRVIAAASADPTGSARRPPDHAV
ncbi:GAF and ANTAR domain-containing protein [Saccharothrix yanglingensis]|uniref:GAF and ANTAR domain-containing protein n=1 Tax=Saccharothrix yanglingensis TaxID=659496 RepID=UPI0027D21027|nr:GAF and ANTAR domain-containing protein [Saccharothrix yanglingensis]